MKQPTHLPKALRRLDNFFFAEATSTPWAYLRIGISTLLLMQGAMVFGQLGNLYGDQGILQQNWATLSLGKMTTVFPGLVWTHRVAHFLKVADSQIFSWIVLLYAFSLGFTLVGLFFRPAIVLATATHFLVLCSGFNQSYGFDRFAQVALFYLMFSRAADTLSLDAWYRGVPSKKVPSSLFLLRLLQLHLCIAYLATAVAKASSAQWWNGEAIWRALMLTGANHIDFAWLYPHRWTLTFLGWSTLLIEGGYAFFIWPSATRYVWASLIVALHLGIGITLGLVNFSLIMVTLTLCAFVLPRALTHSAVPN